MSPSWWTIGSMVIAVFVEVVFFKRTTEALRSRYIAFLFGAAAFCMCMAIGAAIGWK